MVRKTIFWIHLTCGVTTGLVVAMMSVTGVLLTYERQILAWADRAQSAAPAPGEARRPLAELLAAVKSHDPSFAPTSITVRNDPAAPVAVSAGRSGTVHVNPYTAEVAPQGATELRAFFGAVTGWHRWFNASGESRAPARAITGASNLAFLFLILSGLYLWLPRTWKWVALKTRLFFNPRATTSKARDFNWHHVFGIWSAIPLAVVVATATVFSYPWANDLVYRSVGEEPPVRGGPGAPGRPGNAPAGGPRADGTETAAAAGVPLSYDELLARAAAHAGQWRTLTLNVPSPDAAGVRIGIDQGNGGQPQRRHTVTLDARTGDVQAWQPFSSQSTGQRARSWIRFLHTGEALGIVGQTVAGLVSFTSVLMVWTGLALAYRRLIAPFLARKTTARRASAA
jgi:uncharacterized iron-regulated membrane protein